MKPWTRGDLSAALRSCGKKEGDVKSAVGMSRVAVLSVCNMYMSMFLDRIVYITYFNGDGVDDRTAAELRYFHKELKTALLVPITHSIVPGTV